MSGDIPKYIAKWPPPQRQAEPPAVPVSAPRLLAVCGVSSCVESSLSHRDVFISLSFFILFVIHYDCVDRQSFFVRCSQYYSLNTWGASFRDGGGHRFWPLIRSEGSPHVLILES